MGDDFAKRLYQWTIHRAVTQKVLALKADLPASSVHALLMGEREPTSSEVVRLAQALDIAPADLTD